MNSAGASSGRRRRTKSGSLNSGQACGHDLLTRPRACLILLHGHVPNVAVCVCVYVRVVCARVRAHTRKCTSSASYKSNRRFNITSRQTIVCITVNIVLCAVPELWPAGKYALPRPVYGCPSQSLHNWTAGMASIQLRPRQHNASASSWSRNFHHLGTNDPNKFIMTTCATGRDESVTPGPTERKRPAWPKGNYCTYKTGGDCPKGLCNICNTFDDS